MTDTRKSDKKLVAMRLSGEVRAALAWLAEKTGKTKTRLAEEAVLLQAKGLGGTPKRAPRA